MYHTAKDIAMYGARVRHTSDTVASNYRNKYPSMRQAESADSNEDSVFRLEQSRDRPSPIAISRGYKKCEAPIIGQR